MASLIEGYEYDIFISYRHKDNKYDGWVSEFVNNLRLEIAATFKEELSIYFDENPQDGLLETQHVDKSLEGKLKCLIFIPILSQTYCDPNSFAWENEFKVFNRLASDDPYGMYIRLANGNVNSRILPIRIHELDEQDHQTLEQEMGGTLRSIDFIYRTPGVNRPLRAHEDEPKENLNHTFYRDQVNKVANTVKKLIAGIRMAKQGGPKLDIKTEQVAPQSTGRFNLKWAYYLAALLLIFVVGYFAWPSGSGASTEEPSIAVLPFADMSPTGDQEYFSDGLSEELLNLLARIPNLKVISRTSAFSFKGKNEDIRTIGNKLGVNHVLEGSVRKSGNQLRITAQLIQVSDGAHKWSKTYDRDLNNIFAVQDEIANAVVQELKLTLMGNPNHQEGNSEAFNLYLQGKYYFSKRGADNISEAVALFRKALEVDANHAESWAALSIALAALANNGNIEHDSGFEEAKAAARNAIASNSALAAGHYALASVLSTYDWDWQGAEQEYRKALTLEPANIGAINGMANLSLALGNFDEAIELYEKALELDPLRSVVKINLAMALLHSGKINAALARLKEVEQVAPDFPTLHYQIAQTYLLQKRYSLAKRELEQEDFDDWKLHGEAILYSMTKEQAKADSTLALFIQQFKDVSAFQIAQVYGARNENDQALKWLDTAYQQRDGGLTTTIGNPWFRSLEKDGRFDQFLKKLGLK